MLGRLSNSKTEVCSVSKLTREPARRSAADVVAERIPPKGQTAIRGSVTLTRISRARNARTVHLPNL